MTNDAVYYEEWRSVTSIFGGKYEGKAAILKLDVGLNRLLPMSDKTTLLQVVVGLLSSDEEGLPSEESEEEKRLDEIGTHLDSILSSRFDAKYAGIFINNGTCLFNFYAEHFNDVENAVADAMKNFPTYQSNCHRIENDNWGAYKDWLFTDFRYSELFKSLYVVESLTDSGDKLTEARPVDHWIYFRTSQDRQQFIERVQKEGFEIKDRNDDADYANHNAQFGVNISRVDKVDPDNLFEYISMLWDTAYECCGIYDGWETCIVKE
ncbi:hypothetical protein FACS189427_05670 [Planctomycetales bacterium]|nr:hypothetical protein FACS189427_05670 [Planctomycetales bacterium]